LKRGGRRERGRRGVVLALVDVRIDAGRRTSRGEKNAAACLVSGWTFDRVARSHEDEIVIDGAAREMCDGFERRISAGKFASRAGVDPSDARKAMRKLVELGLQKRSGSMRDPGGCVAKPASSEEAEPGTSTIADAGGAPVPALPPPAVVVSLLSFKKAKLRAP
jgi:hypothetical protein